MTDESNTASEALPPPERPPLLDAPDEDAGRAAVPAVLGWIEKNQTTAMLGAFFVGVFTGVLIRG